MVCDEATQNLALLALDKVLADCQARKAHGAAALKRLLDTLEPGGPKGQVQVGYTATLELLKLYRHTPKGWVIDDAKVSALLDLSPVVRHQVFGLVRRFTFEVVNKHWVVFWVVIAP